LFVVDVACENVVSNHVFRLKMSQSSPLHFELQFKQTKITFVVKQQHWHAVTFLGSSSSIKIDLCCYKQFVDRTLTKPFDTCKWAFELDLSQTHPELP
jgi:hypothetical protein